MQERRLPASTEPLQAGAGQGGERRCWAEHRPHLKMTTTKRQREPMGPTQHRWTPHCSAWSTAMYREHCSLRWPSFYLTLRSEAMRVWTWPTHATHRPSCVPRRQADRHVHKTKSQDPHFTLVFVTKSYALVLQRRQHDSSTLDNLTDREVLPLGVARCAVAYPSLLRGVARLEK